jgi:hypothetical protein
VLTILEGLREFWPFSTMEGAKMDMFCTKAMGVDSCK